VFEQDGLFCYNQTSQYEACIVHNWERFRFVCGLVRTSLCIRNIKTLVVVGSNIV
jgi:hypothetical protein